MSEPPLGAPDDTAASTESAPPHRAWLLLAIPVCLFLGVIELERALGGHARAWVYAFEWPGFAVWLYYIYVKLKRNEPIFKPYRPEDYPDEPSQTG